jgi:glutamate-1-semialdehyde 2,1-aminomutase
MFDVVPDLAVFSKALGGGLPIAAFAGQRHVMEPLAQGHVKHGAMFQTVFTADGTPTRQYRDLLRTDQARYNAFRHELLKRGVHTNAYGMACWFVAATVTEDDLDATCEAVEGAFAAL